MVESSVQFEQNPDQINLIISKSEADQQSIKALIGTSKVDQEDKRASDELDCSICLQIIYNPVECSNCQKCFCEDCVNSWLQAGKNDSCPLCKQKLSAKQPHRFVKQFIEDSLFDGCKFELCNQFGKSIKYIDLIKHYQYECEEVKVSCPLKCGGLYQRKFRQQHRDQCNQIQWQCTQCDCNKLDIDETQPPHNCIEYLKQQVKLYKLKYEISEQQFEEYKTQIKGLKDNYSLGYYQKEHYQTIVHKCPLKMIVFEQMRSLPGHEGYNLGWCCDGRKFIGCKSGQALRGDFCRDPESSIFHCNICNFDFCEACYDTYGNVHKHDLVKLAFQQLKELNSNYADGWKCDGTQYFGCPLGQNIQTDLDELLYHDAQNGFDLCDVCFQNYVIDEDQ
ncbi:wd-40 repeat protein [Stylonychia lemnae]|uniref:Wd-40 repeat protein n=1 Tax=Stylonychia lemnae TaxID=5949 RepID=A0A078APK9_STYLE|nr:wd-40 repeat protein [Stylonychia lemnae]|eukprot:CDW83886.1 wd-40 repeat protein [Stylonychia lemnae]